MILPGSHILTITLLILSMLCLGSWANTFKLAGPKWRFELYYFDFAIGAFIAALVAALTFGSLGWDGFSFLDDLRNAGKRQDVEAFIAGAVFNLGNMLLVAAISVAGMSVAFPLAAGLALVLGVIIGYFTNPTGNPTFLGFGSVAIIAAILVGSLAYRKWAAIQKKRHPAPAPVRGKVVADKKASSGAAILLALAGGIFLGCFSPLLDMARDSDNGVGPYSLAVLFASGILVTTLGYNLFFMNLPVQGQPVDFGEYFKGGSKTHLLGILGGVIFSIGAVTSLVAFKAEGAAHANAALSYGLNQAAIPIAALFGLFAWKEFADAEGSTNMLVFVMLALLVCGIGLVSVAPNFR